jgi:arylsulfatase
MDTPYQWTKQVASHWGGVRNGTIIHWPAGIESKGEVRNQFHHVIDVAPTLLEAAGIPEPKFVEGVMQSPMEGTSMAYSFNDRDAKDRHTIQYFEMFGNRGIYQDGWTAVTRHSIPWELTAKSTPFNEDVWELYDTNTDWTQAHDLATEKPDKLAELQQQFLIEAARYNVLPLDDRRMERAIPSIAGRPTLIKGDTQVLFPGMAMGENNVVDIKNKSYAVTANVTFPESDAEGVITKASSSTSTTSSASIAMRWRRLTSSQEGTTRCDWSLPMMAVGSARAVQPRSTLMAIRSRRAASSTPTRPSSLPTPRQR